MGGNGSVGNPRSAGPHEGFRLGIMGFNQFRQAVLHIQTDLMIREGQAVVTINGTFDPAGPSKGFIRTEKHRLNLQQIFRNLCLHGNRLLNL